MDGPATFGEWLKLRRQALHLSRPELAQRASCSVPALRKIEAGERRPSQQLAELLASAIGLQADEQPAFIRVARGELTLDRLPAATPGAGNAAPGLDAHLPHPVTPLIGREAELAEVERLLADRQCRLLTLTGPGGIGKTRLAIAVATAHSAAYGQPARFVALAALHSPDLISSAIADALRFKFSGPADPAAQLLDYLGDKSLLLVLDNCEHLLDGMDLLAPILERAPGVKLLATSRQQLALKAEWTFELHGLPLPPADASEAPGAFSATALFAHSARQARAGLELQADDWPAAARICRLVAGVPLAIELAAAWWRVLSCAEIAAEIERSLAYDGGLDFLSTSLRDVPERHRSMRAVIDHSWKLLSAEEQRVLRQLAVFRGGFTREAAEQVAGASLALLSALVGKSLVQRAGSGRYDLHELVRQYAAARLQTEADERASTCERHSQYYLGWLQEREARLKSHQQREAVAELTGEMENIRAAWDWSVGAQRFVPLYRCARTLMYLLEVRNWFKEAEATFRKTAEALRASQAGGEPDARHQAIWNVMLAHGGFFRMRLGRGDEAYASLAASAARLRSSGEPGAALDALWYLSIDCWLLGKFAEAQDSLREGLRLAREQGEAWHEAWFREFLGGLALEQGEYDQARRHLSQALALMRPIGDPSFMAHALSYLGRTLQLLGEYQEAERVLREGLALADTSDYRFARGLALDGLGQVAYAQHRHAEARALLAECAELFRAMGDTHRLSRTLNHQGLNDLALGDTAGAHTSFETALRLAYSGGFLPAVLSALTGLAALETHAAASRGALELVQFVLLHPSSAQETRTLAAALELGLRARLPQEAIEAAQQRTVSRSLAEVVGQVLAGG